jgi:hypothetical protein
MHNIKFQIKGELDFKIFMQFCAAIYLKFCFFFADFDLLIRQIIKTEEGLKGFVSSIAPCSTVEMGSVEPSTFLDFPSQPTTELTTSFQQIGRYLVSPSGIAVIVLSITNAVFLLMIVCLLFGKRKTSAKSDQEMSVFEPVESDWDDNQPNDNFQQNNQVDQNQEQVNDTWSLP